MCLFYRGYFKHRNSCPLKHSILEFDVCCEDKRICPKRHRINCKNGDTCAFVLTKSYEFLHKNTDNGNAKSDRTVFQPTLRVIEDKFKDLSIKGKEKFNKMANIKS